jgi:WD40 repeat protein
VLIWDLSTGSHQWVSQPHPTPIRRLAWSPDGMQLAGGGDNGLVYLWDANGTLLHWLSGHERGIKSLAWSPDGSRLASAGGGKENGELFVWDANRGERLIAFDDHPEIVYAVSWGSSDDLLVSGGGDGRLRCLNCRAMRPVGTRSA